MPRILVVEDDQRTAESIKLYLEHDGFEARLVADGISALELCRTAAPDLVILDRMLPLLDGTEICRRLRASGNIPIIMLTARTTEADKLEGLHLGADDYVTKPFSPRELVARVHAVLRRAAPAPALRFGAIAIDFERGTLHRSGEPVALTTTEFKLLETLCRAPGRIFSRSDLLERIFGWDYEGTERTVDVHIANLRRKIEDNPAQPALIATVFGAGYKWIGVPA